MLSRDASVSAKKGMGVARLSFMRVAAKPLSCLRFIIPIMRMRPMVPGSLQYTLHDVRGDTHRKCKSSPTTTSHRSNCSIMGEKLVQCGADGA